MSGAKAEPRPRDPKKGPAVDALGAAEMIGVTRDSIYNYIDWGDLDYYTERQGKRLVYMIYVKSIKEFTGEGYR